MQNGRNGPIFPIFSQNAPVTLPNKKRKESINPSKDIFMKKILTFLLVIMSVQFGLARNVITMNPKELPEAAQTFLKQYFENRQISYIKVESEFLSKKYEVVMTDRTKIEFDGKGNWEEVDCKRSELPKTLVPDYIQRFVNEQYPGVTYRKIERDRGEIEVELSNRLSLKFDKKGRLTDIDD